MRSTAGTFISLASHDEGSEIKTRSRNSIKEKQIQKWHLLELRYFLLTINPRIYKSYKDERRKKKL